jgi:hypothetical protein
MVHFSIGVIEFGFSKETGTDRNATQRVGRVGRRNHFSFQLCRQTSTSRNAAAKTHVAERPILNIADV